MGNWNRDKMNDELITLRGQVMDYVDEFIKRINLWHDEEIKMKENPSLDKEELIKQVQILILLKHTIDDFSIKLILTFLNYIEKLEGELDISPQPEEVYGKIKENIETINMMYR